MISSDIFSHNSEETRKLLEASPFHQRLNRRYYHLGVCRLSCPAMDYAAPILDLTHRLEKSIPLDCQLLRVGPVVPKAVVQQTSMDDISNNNSQDHISGLDVSPPTDMEAMTRREMEDYAKTVHLSYRPNCAYEKFNSHHEVRNTQLRGGNGYPPPAIKSLHALERNEHFIPGGAGATDVSSHFVYRPNWRLCSHEGAPERRSEGYRALLQLSVQRLNRNYGARIYTKPLPIQVDYQQQSSSATKGVGPVNEGEAMLVHAHRRRGDVNRRTILESSTTTMVEPHQHHHSLHVHHQKPKSDIDSIRWLSSQSPQLYQCYTSALEKPHEDVDEESPQVEFKNNSNLTKYNTMRTWPSQQHSPIRSSLMVATVGSPLGATRAIRRHQQFINDADELQRLNLEEHPHQLYVGT